MPEGYQVRRVGDDWGTFHRSLNVAMIAYGRRLRNITGPYEITKADGTWSGAMTRKQARDRTRSELTNNPEIGARVRVRGTPHSQFEYVIRRFFRSAGPAVLKAALSQLGVPYVFGAEAPGVAFDCSGLSAWSYAQVGVLLPHSAAAQYDVMQHCPVNLARPGDLLFYEHPIGHVAELLDWQGGGRVIDTEDPQRPVAVRTFAQVVMVPVGAGYLEAVTGKH